MEVRALDAVDPLTARGFLALYRDAFRPLEAKAPARQALTDEEFLAEMSDRSVVKFVAFDDDDVVALAFMATDLTIVPWISPAYYAARFPEHHRRGAIYYFGGLLVRPDRQGGPWASLLLKEVVRRMADDRAVACFDCCSYNAEVVRLPQLVRAIAHRHAVVDDVELDPQRYFAFAVDGHR